MVDNNGPDWLVKAEENGRKWTQLFFSAALSKDGMPFSVLKAKKDGLRIENIFLMWEGASQLTCFRTFEMAFNVSFSNESMTLAVWVHVIMMMVQVYLIQVALWGLV